MGAERGVAGVVGQEGDGAGLEGPEAGLAGLMRECWLAGRPLWTERDWWELPLREDVRALLWLPPGAGLAAALEGLPHGPVCPDSHVGEAMPGDPAPGHATGWPCACMVVVAAAWEACAAWTAAGAAGALVDAAGPEEVTFDFGPRHRKVVDPAREELGHALRLSPASMGNRIAAARGLLAHPNLVALVAAGAVSAWAARLVVLELADLTGEQAGAVVAQVCAKVTRRLDAGRRAWTSAEVGRAARIARLRICPDSDRAARQRAFEHRRVLVYPSGQGMATLIADLDETDAHRIHRRLSAIAQGLADPADPRTRDQVRADVLVDLLLTNPAQAPGQPGQPGCAEDPGTTGAAGADAAGGAVGAAGPAKPAKPAKPAGSAGAAGSRAEIQVIVTLDTLLGLSQNPAVVPGLGPVNADIARVLAADGRWQAWVVDAAGALTATGSQGYVPSDPLARFVRAREPHCRMPGCRQPAWRSDLDHTIPWPIGPTTPANLGPLCRRHHVLKTHAGWQLEPVHEPSDHTDHTPAGPAWRWRTPAGFTIHDNAEPPAA